jgi:unsaturated rhamnogalacturonyl hydrolase
MSDLVLSKKINFDTNVTTSGGSLSKKEFKVDPASLGLLMDLLIKQLETHPKTSEGGYWHKLIYQHQIWLDGIYMGSPFMAQYGREFNQPKWIDEAIHQVILCYNKTYDAKTGLNYHAWDESKSQKWANPETGQSPNFWGRSMGWFFMATVDVLDFVPDNHPKRAELIAILKKLTAAVGSGVLESRG